MATDLNITMKQYNGVDYDTLYPATEGSQIVSPVPITSGGTNANNAATGMNNLISALSSIAPANSDLIPFKDVSDNTVGTMTVEQLAAIASALGTKLQTGSYVGTGTYGSANPCSLTFDFEPKLVMVVNSPSYYVVSIMMAGVTAANNGGGTRTSDNQMTVAWSEKTVSWYSPNTTQLNTSGATYYYVAIG